SPPQSSCTPHVSSRPLHDALPTSAGHVAARVLGAEAHPHERLGVLRGHAEEASDPHPEQRTRPAEIDGGGHSGDVADADGRSEGDRKSTRLNSSHVSISYAVFCLK